MKQLGLKNQQLNMFRTEKLSFTSEVRVLAVSGLHEEKGEGPDLS